MARFAPPRLDPKRPPIADPRIENRIEMRTPHAPAERKSAGGHLLAILVIVFALLNVADLITTFVGLHDGLHEGNPLMNALLGQYGFIALVLYKAVVIGAVALGVRMLRTFRVSIAHATIIICDVLVLFFVITNVTQYLIRS